MTDERRGDVFASLTEGMSPWMRFTLVVGPTTVIALFLVWSLNTERTRTLETIKTELGAHTASSSAAVAALSTAFTSFSSGQAEQLRELVALSRQQCMQTAKTIDDRRVCTYGR